MFGSQAENCGSKSPYPFIKWEHNLTVAPRCLLRTTSIPCSCILETCCPLKCCRFGARSGVDVCLEGGKRAEWETDPRKLSLGPVECAVRGSQPLSPFNVHDFTGMEPQSEIPHTGAGTFRAPCVPLPSTVVFIFLSWTLLPWLQHGGCKGRWRAELPQNDHYR